MMVKKYIDVEEPLTEEQIKMLERVAALPAVQDDDCPELSAEELEQFSRPTADHCIVEKKRAAAL